jgi:hypothetical protein
MYDLSITRNQFGANNTRDTETFSDQPVEDRTKVHEYNNDFDEFNTANYTVTTLGVAGTTFTAIAGDGGIIQAISSANANAGFQMQNTRADYVMANGFRCFGAWILSVDSALANILAGMFNTNAALFTPANITDGIYMQTLGTSAINIIAVAGGGAKITQSAVATLNPGLTNFVTFKFYWDGAIYQAAPSGRIVWELSGAGVVAPVRGSFGGSSAFPLPTGWPSATAINPSVGITASTGVARTMQVDLFSVIKERSNVLVTPTF